MRRRRRRCKTKEDEEEQQCEEKRSEEEQQCEEKENGGAVARVRRWRKKNSMRSSWRLAADVVSKRFQAVITVGCDLASRLSVREGTPVGVNLHVTPWTRSLARCAPVRSDVLL